MSYKIVIFYIPIVKNEITEIVIKFDCVKKSKKI